MGNQAVMGGVVVLLAGDFRQTLPVFPKGITASEFKACLKASNLWRLVRKLELTNNMPVHLQGDLSTGRFAQELLTLGDRKVPVVPTSGAISIPENFFNIVLPVGELKTSVFSNSQHHFSNHKWLCERAILAPKNDSADTVK